MIKESTLNHPDIIYFQIWINRFRIQENWTWYRSNMYYVYARYIFCKDSARISFLAFENWHENHTATWLTQLLHWFMGKIVLLFSLNVVYIVSRWYLGKFLGPWHVKKTIFASMNQYFIDKLSLFLTEVSFDTSEGNHFQKFPKWLFFKNSVELS